MLDNLGMSGSIGTQLDDPAWLAARAEQLALAQDVLGLVTWVWEAHSDQVVWHGDLSPLLGLPPHSSSPEPVTPSLYTNATRSRGAC